MVNPVALGIAERAMKEAQDSYKRVFWKFSNIGGREGNGIIHATPMVPWPWRLQISWHWFSQGQRLATPVPCPRLYQGGRCIYCEESINGKDKPRVEAVLPMFFHEYYGAKVTVEGVTYDRNPEVLQILPRAAGTEKKKPIVWNAFEDAYNRNDGSYYGVWQLEVINWKLQVPRLLDPRLWNDFRTGGRLPQEVTQRNSALTHDDVIARCLHPMSGIDWTFWGLREPVVPETQNGVRHVSDGDGSEPTNSVDMFQQRRQQGALSGGAVNPWANGAPAQPQFAQPQYQQAAQPQPTPQYPQPHFGQPAVPQQPQMNPQPVPQQPQYNPQVQPGYQQPAYTPQPEPTQQTSMPMQAAPQQYQPNPYPMPVIQHPNPQPAPYQMAQPGLVGTQPGQQGYTPAPLQPVFEGYNPEDQIPF